MKKNVIAAISLGLYLLLGCTILSSKIQEEMTILVTGNHKISSKKTGQDMTIDWRAIYTRQDAETGYYIDHLYEVREGEGWEQGLRCRDVPNFGLNPVMGIASINRSEDAFLVLAASRTPEDGDLAEIVEKFEIGVDEYLYVYTRSLPEERDYPDYVVVTGETANAIMVTCEKAQFPFLPHIAKTWTVTTDAAQAVYSLTEAEEFLTQLPIALAAVLVLTLGLVFWLLGCLLENRHLMRFNALGSAGTLVLSRWLLTQFDLPASMLPSSSVFDFPHYKDEFSLIFDSLRELELTNHTIFQAVILIKNQCNNIGLIFCASAIFVILLEVIYLRKINIAQKQTIQ